MLSPRVGRVLDVTTELEGAIEQGPSWGRPRGGVLDAVAGAESRKAAARP